LDKEQEEDEPPSRDLEERRKVIADYIADLRAFPGQAPAQTRLSSSEDPGKRVRPLDT